MSNSPVDPTTNPHLPSGRQLYTLRFVLNKYEGQLSEVQVSRIHTAIISGNAGDCWRLITVIRKWEADQVATPAPAPAVEEAPFTETSAAVALTIVPELEPVT